jgi:hypothetical protein
VNPSDGASIIPVEPAIGPYMGAARLSEISALTLVLPVVTPARHRLQAGACGGGRFRAASLTAPGAHNPLVLGSSPGTSSIAPHMPLIDW